MLEWTTPDREVSLRYEVGSDGVRDPDDPLYARRVRMVDAERNMVPFMDAAGPGPDGAWDTADDDVSYVCRATFDNCGASICQQQLW